MPFSAFLPSEQLLLFQVFASSTNLPDPHPRPDPQRFRSWCVPSPLIRAALKRYTVRLPGLTRETREGRPWPLLSGLAGTPQIFDDQIDISYVPGPWAQWAGAWTRCVE